MYKAFKYRLYPTAPQAEKINQNIGCARFVYNQLLDDRIKVYKETKQKSKKTYCDLKKEYTFLKDADSRALLNARENLDIAYDKFFKVPSVGFPKFKSKHRCRWSYTTDNNHNAIHFKGNRLKLPKVGAVKVIQHREIEGRIITATISHERSGEYYASVLCEVEQPKLLPVTEKVVGIDLGLHDFIVCSDGQRIQTPKFLRKAEEKLAKRQRAFSKTIKDSKNHEKLRLKVAKCHQKIKNQRKDFLQKLSTKLIHENQVICLEDLSVKGMERNKNLAKSVSDASFSRFVEMLEYKAEWYGRNVVKIDRFYPSTQLCSGCGYKNESIKGLKGLKFREWICPCCGEVHDRDLNASRNILKEGLKSIEPTERGG
jgi:putative transposase